MPFAYVTEPGAQVTKRGRTLIVRKDGAVLAEWELIHLDALVLIGGVHLTTPAMKALLRHGVETAFLTKSGRLIGQLTPPKSGNVQLRIAQYRMQQQLDVRIKYSAQIVTAKSGAMHDVLDRYSANYPKLPLDETRKRLRSVEKRVAQASTIDELRGIEGSAAAAYWQAFRQLNRSTLLFGGRSSHPPKDAVNALLSLGYVLLVNELWALLDAIGFDPYLGFYHELKPNRPSLALDLIEPFRHHIVDRMVLRSINLKRFNQSDFHGVSSAAGPRLSRDAWKVFIADFERAMQSVAWDPVDKCRRNWREIMRRRCERFAMVVRQSTANIFVFAERAATCFDGGELDESVQR